MAYLDFLTSKLFEKDDIGCITDKNISRQYHIMRMLTISQDMFDYDGLPETMPKKEVEKIMQIEGAGVVAPVDGRLYMFRAGFGGEPSAYYNPTTAIVNNPYLGFNKALKIGEECVLAKNDPYGIGLLSTYKRYAELLCENEISMLIASINSRIAFTMVAGDDNTKESGEEFLRKIWRGVPGVILSKNFYDSVNLTVQPGAGASPSVLRELIEHEQYLRAQLYNEIGLNANFNMKREALNSAESALNESALIPLPDVMLKCREDWTNDVNTKYGTNITVRLSEAWNIRGEDNENDA